MVDNTGAAINETLKSMIAEGEKQVKSELAQIEQDQKDGKSLEVSTMFGMQLTMNLFTQISETSTNIASGENSAIMSDIRNFKQ